VTIKRVNKSEWALCKDNRVISIGSRRDILNLRQQLNKGA